MADIIETLQELGVVSQGRNPLWQRQTEFTGSPEAVDDGVSINTPSRAVLAICSIALRENPARYRSRVTVDTLDDTAAVTYTVSIGNDTDEMDFVFVNTGGETAEDVLDGLSAVINTTGLVLTTGDLTFADSDPDTITRASGDFNADGVIPGTQLVIVGGTNPGTFTVATVDSATQVTLVDSDDVTAAGPETVTSVTAFPPVTATVEDRDGDNAGDTLVLERRDVDSQLDAETVTHSTNVSAGGSGVLSAEEDAETLSARMWWLGEITSDDETDDLPLGRMSWTLINNAEQFDLDYRGFVERFEVSGGGQFYCELFDVVGVTTGGTVTPVVVIGPAIQEPAEAGT